MTPRRRAPVLTFLALSAGCARSPRDGGAAPREPVPALSLAGEARVRRIDSRADVPLRGPRVDAKKGDWLIEGPGGVAVVSSVRGVVVDFGPTDGDDALVSLDPTLFIGLEQATATVESVVPAGAGGSALLIRKRMLGDPPLRLWTYVTLADGALRIESTATAAERGAMAITLGEVVSWGNVPTWVEGHGFVRGQETLSGDFIAREGAGVAYALAREQGHLVARFAGATPGFHESARTGELLEGVAAHGQSSRRVVVLTQARGPLGQATRVLPRYALPAPGRWPLPRGAPDGAVVEVAHCDGAPFARFDAGVPELQLPGGCWRARLAASGYAPGDWLSPEALQAAPPEAFPRAGTLHWSLRERRPAGPAVVPGRILVQGIRGTPDPDWGEDPADGASLNVLHVDRDGERPIPPGSYRATVTRGFEYTMSTSDITVMAHQTAVVEAELARVVDTRGWIAADLHVHAAPSPDAPTPLADRVRALAAAGVEVAVATDHNAVTDYRPAIHERGLDRWLASIAGDEVTTRGVLFGHFNVFPLEGAPIPFQDVTPAAVVGVARAAPPADRLKVVQLNHPRMGSIGYFELSRFDPRDVAGWRARSPLDETGFDAIEVYNGDDYALPGNVERNLRDWYALLDAGVRITATGNSDSHKLTYHECGVPRDLVQVGDDDPAHFDEGRFVDAVRAGRVLVSGGPVVNLEVAGHGVGESAPAGTQEVHVTVDAPPWVDVTEVDVVRRGAILRAWTGPFARGVRRLDARFAAAFAKGDWLVAIARGERAMAFLARPGAKPLSFTNPVWIE